MLRFFAFACTLRLLTACQTQAPAPNPAELPTAEDEKGPQVNELVKPNQEKWLATLVQNPAAAGIKKVLVWGDSLSDPGHLNKLSQGALLPPRVFYKSRFSNGPIWSDYVSASLNWSLENYAVGGAETGRSRPLGQARIPSLLDQIGDHKDELKKMEFASTLVVIWIGPDNYLFTAMKAQDANQNPVASRVDELVKNSIDDIRKGIAKLHDLGFRHFLIGTIPELSGINRNPKDPPRASDATLLTVTATHNRDLRAMVKELPKEWPDLKASLFQAFEINQKTSENPKNYGFTRLDTPCFIGNLRGRFDGARSYCKEPSAYKFWEYLHPNSKMHCIYASQFLADLGSAGLISGHDSTKTMARCLEL